MQFDDRVWTAVHDAVVMRKHRRMPTGWINFNCTICHERRLRGGMINTGAVTSISCFNCGWKCSYRFGKWLGDDMRQFLLSLGIPERDVAHLALYTEQLRRLVIDDPQLQRDLDIRVAPSFTSIGLPSSAKTLDEWYACGCADSDLQETVAYLLTRGEVAACATNYYWTPRRSLRRHLIIPCYHDERLVGWVGRAIDDVKQRYYSQVPSNYLFNTRFLNGERHYIPIVEGVFDALLIDGVAALGASLNAQQIAWINQSGKQPVVVPDRDASGDRLVEIAIAQGWPVAAPHYGRHQWWEADVKDAAEAVCRYGKLYVLQSIIATQETHATLIRMRASYHVR